MGTENDQSDCDRLTEDDKHMRKYLRKNTAELFEILDTESNAFAAIHGFNMRLSKVVQSVSERGVLTQSEATEYSFVSCAIAALLYALEHNPIFDQGVFKDQAMHHYDNVMNNTGSLRIETIDSIKKKSAEKGG